MIGAFLNFVLALLWSLLLGEITLFNLVVGYLLGFVILGLFGRVLDGGSYVKTVAAVLFFLGFFLRELIIANVQVALWALSPRPPLYPAIVAVPLRLQQDSSITLLAITITLLPGTVAMGVSPDKQFLYAHSIGLQDLDAAKQAIQKVEDKLLRFMR
jgi:multicomponent Na+:H+ antiporter subunit E